MALVAVVTGIQALCIVGCVTIVALLLLAPFQEKEQIQRRIGVAVIVVFGEFFGGCRSMRMSPCATVQFNDHDDTYAKSPATFTLVGGPPAWPQRPWLASTLIAVALPGNR